MKSKKETKHALGTVLLCVLLAAVLLCACGKNPTEAESTPSGTVAPSDGRALHLLTEPEAIVRVHAQTENGHYETVSNHASSSNIVYTDYATKSRVFLCNDPGCNHDSESCTSYFPLHWIDALFTDGSYLYAGATVIDKDDVYTRRGELIRMGLDGSNREVIVELQAGESFTGAYASDGEKLYFTKLVALEPDPEEEEKSYNLATRFYSIDIDTKEVTELYDSDTGDRCVGNCVGCVGREMIFATTDLLDYEGSIIAMYRAFNVDTRTWRDITEEPMNQRSGIWADGMSIWVSKDGTTINTFDFATAEVQQIELERKIPKTAELRDFQDGKLLARWTEEDHDVSAAIDIETGSFTDAPVFISEASGKSSVMDILADFGEEYLVETAPKQVSVTYFDLDGSVEQYMDEVYPQALIAKEDYWAGNQNVTMIDDHVSLR